MKAILCRLCSIALLLALAAAGAPAAAQAADVAMKITTATVSDAQHEWMKLYAARVQKRLGDKIKIDLFPAGQLGAIPRMVEGLQLGTIEAFVTPTDFFTGVDPRYGIIGAPGVYKSMAHAAATLSDPSVRDELLSMGDAKGVKGVSVIALGVPHYLSKKPIRRIADFNGQKIRVNATKIEQEMMRRVGASGVPMPLSEVQPSLQQGVIDGFRSIMSIFTVGKYEAIAKTVTVTNDSVLISLAALSKPWLDKQTAEIQKILIDEGRAVTPEAQKWASDFIAGEGAKWTAVGGEIVELPAEDRAELARRFAPIGDDVAKENPAAKALYDRIVASAKKHS